MKKFREIAIFIAGITAWEAIVHSSLAFCNMLPLTWCGITITETINTVQMIVSGLISLTLIYFIWVRRSQKD